MKSTIIFIISIMLFVFSFLFFRNISSCRRLYCISMNGLNNFKIKDVYQDSNNTFRALYTNNNGMLKVETISQMNQITADQYINANIAQVKGLFTDALAPYPGVASNTITCDIKYQPSFNKIITANKLEVSYFIGYLNRNLTYGSCTETQAIYKGISAYFYCSKNKQVYHLEIIAPRKIFESSIKDYQNIVKSIKCN
jgi:hypothetical protein